MILQMPEGTPCPYISLGGLTTHANQSGQLPGSLLQGQGDHHCPRIRVFSFPAADQIPNAQHHKQGGSGNFIDKPRPERVAANGDTPARDHECPRVSLAETSDS